METRDRTVEATNQLFGWMGVACLFAIIVIKLMRYLDLQHLSFTIGVIPSILGPAGLLFLLLSHTGRISRLSLLQVTMIVGVLSVASEFAQLLPRPGILARARYTFDIYDLGATVVSVAVAYVISYGIFRRKPTMQPGGE